MTTHVPKRADSRQIAATFRKRHHNVLAALDRVIETCPAAANHIQFARHPVTAGLGGTRYCRHALVDQFGFMLLAMVLPSTMREEALAFALRLQGALGSHIFSDGEGEIGDPAGALL